ncbi:nucleotidyltransferase family protein [Patescibacteria group bacterium]|nr:nucleotidyltransferase family protein [Patescibacteria group bacterium]MBU4512330.1 nucleotidyltransferase family protein [Patescibacteria group bacterium]MCG2692548.1 nucleotidyltransferase family protein [Candidatus Parcubacteria bacterium]
MTIKFIKTKALPIFKRQGITKAAVFGSYARGDNKKSSDIDFLIKAPPKMSLLGLSRLKIDLEEGLGSEVDLVEYSTIHPLLKDRILKEQIAIL